MRVNGKNKDLRPARRARSTPSSPAVERRGVAIVGALRMDLIVHTEIIPAPGQTVPGQDLRLLPGGRGANQAAVVGKLWKRKTARGESACRIVGRIGDDAFGQRILESLIESKVDVAAVARTKGVPTGAAFIIIDRHGENSVVTAGGANQHLRSTDVLTMRQAIERSCVLAVQLEIPFDTAACAIALAKQAGALTILDPAPVPAEGIPESLYHVDIITPNQDAALMLTGVAVRTPDDARRAADRLLARGARAAIINMGSLGAMVVDRDPAGAVRGHHVPGFRSALADALAAGDCFAGALAVALAEGRPLLEAARFAAAAGSLAGAKSGGHATMPSRAEVDALLARASEAKIKS